MPPRTSAPTPSSTASPGRRRAASSPRRWGQSRTRCSTPRPSGSACRATSCSATWRINHPNWYKPAITDLDGVKAIGREVRVRGFGALKTNIFIYENGRPQGWRPGFGRPFYPELNVDKKVLRNLRMHLEALDDGAGL